METPPLDPFETATTTVTVPLWIALLFLLIPLLVWAIFAFSHRRFSMRDLFVLISMYALLFALLAPYVHWDDKDVPDDGFLKSVEAERKLSRGLAPPL